MSYAKTVPLLIIFSTCMIFHLGCSSMEEQVSKFKKEIEKNIPKSSSSKNTQSSTSAKKSVSDEVVKILEDILSGPDDAVHCKKIRSKEDVERFSKPTIKHLLSALRNLTIGAELTFEAAELKQDAERMALIRTKMEQDPSILEDQEKLKEILDEINSATEKISQMDYEARLNRNKAKKNLGEMILRFSIATFYDTKAEACAGRFIACSTKTANDINKDKTLLLENSDLILSIADYARLIKLVTFNISSQIKQVASIRSSLKIYAQKHDIEEPTQAELEQEAEKYEPEIEDEDLT